MKTSLKCVRYYCDVRRSHNTRIMALQFTAGDEFNPDNEEEKPGLNPIVMYGMVNSFLGC